MNKNRLLRAISYILVAAITATATATVLLFSGAASSQSSKLQQLENLILNRYVGEVDQKEMEDAAANAMIEALGDRWSYYLTAEEYAAHHEQEENAYVGIGITVNGQTTAQGLEVLQVAQGGPADQAGILAGDRITLVDGRMVAGLEVSAIQSMIKGDENTKVTLTILRGAQELTVTVTRAAVSVPVATGKMLENSIGLVTIGNFNANCAKETIAAIDALMQDGAKKLIFDVRNNPGGRVSELVAVLDYLLPEGVLFRSQDHTGKEDQETSDAACLEIPMAVIVNENSYSAAEFLAAALQEREWAQIVGEKTSGKGNYQVLFQLPDGSAVGLSVGKYFTPNGVSLEGVGITPDVSVSIDQQTAAKIYAGILDPEEDPQILAAMEALKGQ